MVFVCNKCGQEKPFAERELGRPRCFDCRNLHQREWRRTQKATREGAAKIKAAADRQNRTAAVRLAACRQAAEKRGLICTITLDVYRGLIEQPCHYCGCSLNETGSGLDRKDSLGGYTLDNVVPCCWECNRVKGASFQYDEMLILAPALAAIKRKRASGNAMYSHCVNMTPIT